MEENKQHRTIKSYVLRAARMSPLQKRAIQEWGPLWCLDYRPEPLDLRKATGRRRICLEIGFGMGHATAAMAEADPETGYIGVEVHRPGVGKLLSEITRRGLDNIRIINHDAVEVLRHMIPPDSLDGVHIFFPDPWPKKKHHKRRLIQPEFTRLLCERVTEGGYIYAVSDWEHYARAMKEVFDGTPGLQNPHEGWACNPVPRPETAFERKGRAKNHEIWELFYEKRR